MAHQVAAPEKELRFTRSGQAVIFWVTGAACFMPLTIWLVIASYFSFRNPFLPHPAWAIVPAILGGIAIYFAIQLTRHAYLIFTPLGIEIFPLFFPGKNMQLLWWHEIVDADVTSGKLTLHFTKEKTSGIQLSLAPIEKSRRPLVERAIAGRLARGIPKTSLENHALSL